LHKLLERQLRKCFGSVEATPAALRGVLDLVDQAYVQSDLDRGLLERSMDLVSEELLGANADLRLEREALERRVEERTQELQLANRALEREVEQRKRINKAVQLSEEKYRALFEESLDAICVLTVDGILLDLNQAAVQGLGFDSKEQAVGQSVLHFYVNPDDRQALVAELRAKGFAEGHELELNTLDDRRIVVLASSVGLKDAAGEIVQIRTTLRDITDSRALQGQLLQAQKLEAIGRLSGGVAHEFNNLLTSVAGCSELISLAADPGSETFSLGEEIRAAAARGVDLTQRLLAFGRRQSLVERHLDLNHVVANVLSLLRRLIGEDIEIVTTLEADEASILGDFAQLEQVLVNLSINARDAMPHGGRLEFATRNVEVSDASSSPANGPTPGSYVVISVRDTGTGIDESILEYIFEPFFTTREEVERTGLGLPTVHGIVKQAGGHVQVASSAGQGTTFEIFWPSALEDPGEVAESSSREPMSDAESTVILVVDDDDGVRSLTSRVLKKHGYTAIEASGGEEALELYSQSEGKVTVLVSDVVMPGMQGPELAERLRSQSPQIKVLLMSGYSETLASSGRKSNGRPSAFLQKPFSPSDLIAEVEKLLRAS